VGLGVFGVEGRNHNEAWWIDASGSLAGRYRKQHLVQGLEARFTPGPGAASAVARALEGHPLALAICKDMDFPATIARLQRTTQATAWVVPAWDFVGDGWLHSRMAVLRGVEQGVALLRSAREGRVTLSDAFGRVQAEAVSSVQGALLNAALPVQRQPTVYAAIGGPLQWLWPLALVLLLAQAAARSRPAASTTRWSGSAG
jgi:apolipoprotein N-acyltransferase